ncbi:MAG: alpha/beta hydrolase [Deltaproteobacteria bacterium]|nr:alpha/beta hydrolase [Deltaproteobacteria bacterium]
MEEAVRIPCDELELEGRLSLPRSPALGVVLCHPHPLMGGDMHSPPVAWLREVLASRGAAVLRFNFRGTGTSGGVHGGGVAEQRDVEAALSFLSGRVPHVRVALAGYSFGALVAARVVAAGKAGELFALGLIAPPCAMAALPPLSAAAFPGGVVAVAGDGDEICPAAELRAWAEPAGVRCEILRGEDHFLGGAREALGRIFSDWVAPDAA